MIRVEHVLDSWKTVRGDTAVAVEDMPAADLDFKPTPDVDTFRDIARHILEAGAGLTGLLLAGYDNFATPAFREQMKDHATGLPADAGAAQLAAALRESVQQRTAAFALKPEAFFAEMVTRFDGQQVTRLEMLQTIKEHELGHRQQLFGYLRLKGIVPATTRRRLAKQAAK